MYKIKIEKIHIHVAFHPLQSTHAMEIRNGKFYFSTIIPRTKPTANDARELFSLMNNWITLSLSVCHTSVILVVIGYFVRKTMINRTFFFIKEEADIAKMWCTCIVIKPRNKHPDRLQNYCFRRKKKTRSNTSSSNKKKRYASEIPKRQQLKKKSFATALACWQSRRKSITIIHPVPRGFAPLSPKEIAD